EFDRMPFGLKNTYLGHVISKDGVKPDPKKLEAYTNKVGKTNANADALSRNSVDFSEENCNIISHNKPEPTKSKGKRLMQNPFNAISRQTRSQTRSKKVQSQELQQHENGRSKIEIRNDSPDKISSKKEKPEEKKDEEKKTRTENQRRKTRYIQQCLQCQPMTITDTPGSLFDKIAMDVVGPLSKTEKRNKRILTLQDQLIKFCMGILLPDQTAKAIAEAFVDKFICILEASKAILTYQGRNFISELIKKIAKLFRIRKRHTTAFHPQSNASLERFHHALGKYLKQYANDQKQWNRWIGLAIFNYNTSIHEATKHISYKLVFGKIARTSSNELLGPEDKLASYDEYRINLVMQLSKETLVKT
ncbi:POL4 protein, partial [Pseudoatta argentina]